MLVGLFVDRLNLAPSADDRARWTLRARLGFRAYGGRDVRPRCHVKAASLEDLTVRQDHEAWVLTANLET